MERVRSPHAGRRRWRTTTAEKEQKAAEPIKINLTSAPRTLAEVPEDLVKPDITGSFNRARLEEFVGRPVTPDEVNLERASRPITRS